MQEGRIAGWQDFVDLARFRVQEILLVSSLYDSFTLAEDDQLNELVLSEFLDLNLRHPPALTRVSTGREALARASEGRFNLILTSLHVGDMDAVTLARRVRETGADTPVALLAYDASAVADFVAAHDPSDLAGVFLWQGDVRILPALVKARTGTSLEGNDEPYSIPPHILRLFAFYEKKESFF